MQRVAEHGAPTPSDRVELLGRVDRDVEGDLDITVATDASKAVRGHRVRQARHLGGFAVLGRQVPERCLLYTSDAADE